MDAKDGGLYRISPTSLTLETLIEPSDGNEVHRTPQQLPNRKGILFTLLSADAEKDSSRIMVLREPGTKPTQVWQGGFHAKYLDSGHLVYSSQGALYALPFDIETLTAFGAPTQVIAPIYSTPKHGIVNYDVSSDGHLAYINKQWTDRLYEFVLSDAQGITQSLGLSPGIYASFDLSKNGKHLAYEFYNGSQSDIWMCYMEQGFRHVRLTFDSANDSNPIWSPNGESVVFTSERNGQRGLYSVRADDSDQPKLLFPSESHIQATAWHPDGHLVVNQENKEGQRGIYILTLEGDETTGWRGAELTQFIYGPFQTFNGSLSPNGKWMAYVSTETGQARIYVQRFPTGGGKLPISREGLSREPIWSPTEDSLVFYEYHPTESLRGIKKVDWTLEENRFNSTESTLLEHQPRSWLGIYLWGYELMPDGKSLLFLDSVSTESENEEPEGHVVFHENFFETLRQKAPPQAAN
jgi:hypothetical protein